MLPCQDSNRCAQDGKVALGFENIFALPFSIDNNGKRIVKSMAGLWL